MVRSVWYVIVNVYEWEISWCLCGTGVSATDAFASRPRVSMTASIAVATSRIDTTAATRQSGEPFVISSNSGETASVWVGVSSTVSGVLRVSVVDANFDSVVAVYTDSANTLASLTKVAADDDCASRGTASTSSCVKVYVSAGAVYAIQVSGFGTSKGLATLSLSRST